jgi:hypothetical protein
MVQSPLSAGEITELSSFFHGKTTTFGSFWLHPTHPRHFINSSAVRLIGGSSSPWKGCLAESMAIVATSQRRWTASKLRKIDQAWGSWRSCSTSPHWGWFTIEFTTVYGNIYRKRLDFTLDPIQSWGSPSPPEFSWAKGETVSLVVFLF